MIDAKSEAFKIAQETDKALARIEECKTEPLSLLEEDLRKTKEVLDDRDAKFREAQTNVKEFKA